MNKLTIFQKIILIISSVIYIIICHAYYKVSGEKFDTAVILILLISGLCFLFSKITEQQFQNITIFISCVCVVCTSLFVYSADYSNGFNNHIDAGTAYMSVINNGGLPLLNKIDTSDGTRFNQYGVGANRNMNWIYDVSGINFYISVYNNNIDLFHSAMAINTGSPTCYSYDGLDRRSELEALLGVNHFFVNSVNIKKPIGFDQLEAEENINGAVLQSYKATNNNSLFYKFDKKISYDDFNSLNPIEKQQVLMQACVVDKDEANTSIDKLNIESSDINYSITPMDGVSIDGNNINVLNDGGQVELYFDNQNNKELYLYLKKIRFENGESGGYSISTQGYNSNQSISNLSDSFLGYTWYSHMYGEKLNWLLNLGTTTNDVNKIVITFNNAGTYTVDDIKIYTRSIESVQNNINSLQRIAKNIQYKNNSYNCDVNMDMAGVLFTSIPYSKGWTAYDNGKKISINKTNVAFMSFNLDEGEHHIKLVYRTPGLCVGIVITIVSIIILIFINRRRKYCESK